MKEPFAGRVAVITGAARGIGRACASKLAEAGADLFLNDCAHGGELDDLTAHCEARGRRAVSFLGDVANISDMDAMFAAAEKTYGKIDILINNAAWSTRKPFLDLTPEESQRTFAVGLWGSFYCSQLAAKHMVRQGGGNIVMISSVHAFRPYLNAAPYNAAKAGVNHLVASLALELAPMNIRVNAVEPGWIDTPGERMHNTEAQIQERSSPLPMQRLGTPEEVADAVAFLCSDAARYCTGTALRVDGGFSLKF